ncbi:MAG: DUF3307 domain-containing protein [Candidatus Omnitrophica bacterium]|nr:DUF3307 domain-containing protein [Candidatus Omnitrophota bacterium]
MILAHFIGDFLLQFDKLYALKNKHISGVFLHSLIIYCCLLAFSWPYLGQISLWILVTPIASLHFIQDWAKIRFTKDSKHNLFFFILDQILHVSLLAALFLTNLRTSVPPLNSNNNMFIALYNNDFIVLYLAAVIISSYMGYFVIVLFKNEYLHQESHYTYFEKNYGFAERFMITSILLIEALSLFLIPFVLALRPLLFRIMKRKWNLSVQFVSLREMILSGAYGALIGLIFRFFV